MRKIIFLIMLLQGAGICQGAAVYEWKDNAGVLHFTDDPKKVPSRYRDKVQKRDMGGDETKKDATPPVQVIPSTPTPPIQPPPSAQPRADMLGGHSGGWWRNRFASLKTQIAALQGGLSGKEQRLNDVRRKHLIFQRPQDRTAANELASEIDRDQTRMKELEAELAALQQDADRAGVPPEWR